MRSLPLLMLIPLMPANAEQPDIQCPGKNTIEMRWCASKSLRESDAALEKKLSAETLKQWKEATQEACTAAYRPYLQGTIYPQMVAGCNDRLNKALLKEMESLGN